MLSVLHSINLKPWNSILEPILILYGTSLEVKTLSIVLYFLMSIFRSWDLEHDFYCLQFYIK